MKAIVCEMCDGRNVVKQDGMYVCQSCGTKYSVEEAKKLMVEVGDAPIPAAPVTRSAPSSELDNLYTLARRARNDNNSENAKKYYEMILPLDPNSWEANFFTIFYQAMTCKIAEIQSAALSPYSTSYVQPWLRWSTQRTMALFWVMSLTVTLSGRKHEGASCTSISSRNHHIFEFVGL